MGSTISVVAMLLSHMDRNMDVTMKPNRSHSVLVPMMSRMRIAIL